MTNPRGAKIVKPVFVTGSRDPVVSNDGKTGYLTLTVSDTDEPDLEIKVSLQNAAGPIIGHLLQMGSTAATTLRQSQHEPASVPVGVVPIAPQSIGLRSNRRGQVVLGLQFGLLHLAFPIPVSELQGMADFLSEHASLATGGQRRRVD